MLRLRASTQKTRTEYCNTFSNAKQMYLYSKMYTVSFKILNL